jgi:hypothetical protein
MYDHEGRAEELPVKFIGVGLGSEGISWLPLFVFLHIQYITT